MKRAVRALALGGLLAAFLFAFQGSPMLSTVDPDSGKQGDTVSAKGQNLGKKSVGELYFTDGKNDHKVPIVEQGDEEIKFTVPKVAAGRYRLMFLTANKASYIEQPVVFTVSE